ncbi:CpaF family protein [Oceanisphaera arctica]|uniref:Pilus assembly protein CpaF n=1 Tax=Oceanisphaera arctica TaxID=641510 RepID=A0A2P5TJC3_9GAMM|nr:CpaF family protein [Oceanisphaera arctica]PPL15064.1 pilus assembly protein CpaF [Oceanisphaera arctica]GHA17690.1 Flp pilus assembly protein TadA [Oceanisphaera arctica]
MNLEDYILNTDEEAYKHRLHGKLMDMLDLPMLQTISREQASEQIERLCFQIMQDSPTPLSVDSRQKIVRQLLDEILGHGPLEPLLADPGIADIMVNGAKSIYVERRGRIERVPLTFTDDDHLMGVIERIVSSVGRRIDELSPMVDARLKDGSRVNAIIPPLALNGPTLSIRRFTVEKLAVDTLIDFGTITPAIAQVMEAVVKGKLNILISGGTGTGKTTFLNILSGFIPSNQRIITVEDSAELQLQQPHVVQLESRPANIEGKGEIAMRDLVKNTLRMRPDRIVVGEVRGAEAFDMLTAMNTGHEGSLTTIHANTPRDALGRLENMVSMTGFDMPVKNIRSQVASALDLIIQLERQEDGTRRMVSMQEVHGMEGETITMSEIFTFERTGIDAEGKVQGRHKATGVMPNFYDRLARRGMVLPRSLFGDDELHQGIF